MSQLRKVGPPHVVIYCKKAIVDKIFMLKELWIDRKLYNVERFGLHIFTENILMYIFKIFSQGLSYNYSYRIQDIFARIIICIYIYDILKYKLGCKIFRF